MANLFRAAELGAELLERSDLAAERVAGRVLEEIDLAKPKVVPGADGKLHLETPKDLFLFGGRNPRRSLDIADDPARRIPGKAIRITPEAPAKLADGVGFDYAAGSELPSDRTRISQIVFNWKRLPWQENVGGTNRVAASAMLSSGDTASMLTNGDMRVATKNGFLAEVCPHPRDPLRIGSVRVTGPGIAAKEPEYRFVDGERPTLDALFASSAEPASAAQSGARPAAQQRLHMATPSGEPARAADLAVRAPAFDAEMERAASKAPDVKPGGGSSREPGARSFVREPVLPAERALADVVRTIVQDGERLAARNDGLNGYLRITKGADGIFTGSFEAGPHAGTTLLWSKPGQPIFVERADGTGFDLSWYKTSAPKLGDVDPKRLWVGR